MEKKKIPPTPALHATSTPLTKGQLILTNQPRYLASSPPTCSVENGHLETPFPLFVMEWTWERSLGYANRSSNDLPYGFSVFARCPCGAGMGRRAWMIDLSTTCTTPLTKGQLTLTNQPRYLVSSPPTCGEKKTGIWNAHGLSICS